MGQGIVSVIIFLTIYGSIPTRERAIGEAQMALARLNDAILVAGRDTLNYGIDMYVGGIKYGNIGSRNRLDFTVIGPAVNIASRLESLTKEVKRSVPFSKALVARAGCETTLRVVGSYPLRGHSEPSLRSRS